MIRVVLLKIIVPGVTEPLHYQSYQTADYAYSGKLWKYLPLSLKSQPEQNLELIAENAQIWVLSNSYLASLIRAYDGLRRSVVQIFIVDPTGTTPDGSLLLQISSSTPIGGYFVFNLGTPTSALTGAAVSRFFSKLDFPHNPQRRANL